VLCTLENPSGRLLNAFVTSVVDVFPSELEL
jgi:hypothetical protein